MSKNIKTEAICYWGKANTHTAKLTARGDLILYWGKKRAPAFTLRGAEVAVETDAHITVELASPIGFIELENIGKYSWSTDEGVMIFVDTRGRSLRVSPSGDVEEETFTPVEAQKVAIEIDKIRAKEREEKSGKILQILVGIAALAYLWKVLFK